MKLIRTLTNLPTLGSSLNQTMTNFAIGQLVCERERAGHGRGAHDESAFVFRREERYCFVA